MRGRVSHLKLAAFLATGCVTGAAALGLGMSGLLRFTASDGGLALVILAAVLLGYAAYASARAVDYVTELRRPFNTRLCPACGYDLRGNPGRDCPECGAPARASRK